MSELDDIRARLDELQNYLHKRRVSNRTRPVFNFRVSPEEADLIDAACRQRGVCRSDLMRFALTHVLQTVLPTKRNIPPQLRRWVNRKSTRHHLDPQTNMQERQIVADAIAERTKLIRAGSAVHVQQATLSDAPSPVSGLKRPT